MLATILEVVETGKSCQEMLKTSECKFDKEQDLAQY